RLVLVGGQLAVAVGVGLVEDLRQGLQAGRLGAAERAVAVDVQVGPGQRLLAGGRRSGLGRVVLRRRILRRRGRRVLGEGHRDGEGGAQGDQSGQRLAGIL